MAPSTLSYSSVPLDDSEASSSTAPSSAPSQHFQPAQSQSVPDYRFKAYRDASPSGTQNLRARMPPPNAPLLPRNNNPVQQMHREGRLPGQRELDFYQKMTPENQRFTKLYTMALILNAATFAGMIYSWYLINWEPLFSSDAKRGLFFAFRMRGAGGLLLWAVVGVAWSLACFVWLHNNLEPLPSGYSRFADGVVGAGLPVWVLLAIMALKRKWSAGSAYDEDWDPCTAPGADKWKQAPCGEVRGWVGLVQMLALAAAAGAFFCHAALVWLHQRKARDGSRHPLLHKGYARLSQNELSPYEIHDDDQSAGPSGHFR